jgi:two-component system sensor histidine kinase DesK
MAANGNAVRAGTPTAGRPGAGARFPGVSAQWRRFATATTGPSVLFSLIWQIFLVYPVLAVVYSGASTARMVLGLVSIAAFSVVYLVAFASPAVTEGYPLHLPRRERRAERSAPTPADGGSPRAGEGRWGDDWLGPDEQEPAPLGLTHLAALAICASGTFPAAGLNGVVNFLPFLACFAAAAWPLRWSVPVALALIIAGSAAALVEGEAGMLVPCLLVFPVVLSMLGARISVGFSDRESHYRRALDVVEERERVARDLHDVLGHTLTALTIRAQLARAQLDAEPEATRRELANIEELTRTALSEMRQTVSGMRVADPVQELAVLTESLRTAGIDVLVVGAPSLIPPEHSALVAWTLREAGTNIARHSGAGRVTIEFTRGHVRITDDGTGIDSHRATAPGSAGQGLTGLARRAEDAAARLAVRDLRGESVEPGAAGSGSGGPAVEPVEPVGGPVTGTVVELEWAR